jgi:tRNA-methyltransferase O
LFGEVLSSKNFRSLAAFSLWILPRGPIPHRAQLLRLIKREGNRLFVQGLDFLDGTPILDIKGNRPQYRTDNYVMPIGFAVWPMTKVTFSPEDFRRTANLSFYFPQ